LPDGLALVLAMLARTPRVADKVLNAADETGDAPAARRLDATKPSLDEVLDRIERHRGGRVGLGQAAVDLAEERANR
jgi:hypothetical protein